MTTPYTLPEPFLTLQGKSKGKLTGEVMNLFDGPAMSRAYADGFTAGAVSRDGEIYALRADAESWRKYKARKDAVIAAGMGRNPLRTEAQRKSDAFDSLPDDYGVN